MYKLCNSYIDRMIGAKLTSKEIDFLLHVALYQDDHGTVESVYYKEVCSSLNVSIQSFYNILNSLSKHNLIKFKKINAADIQVTLIGNDFSDIDYKNNTEGYLNIEKNDFSSERFRSLKAGAKLLYLYSQRFLSGKHMLLNKFYNEYKVLFGVTAKSIQLYVHDLKKRALLFITKKRNKNYNYEVVFKPSTILHKKVLLRHTENDRYIENIVNLIKNNFKRNIPEKKGNRVVKDIAETAINRCRRSNSSTSVILSAIRESLKIKQNEGDKNPILNAALVNKCMNYII